MIDSSSFRVAARLPPHDAETMMPTKEQGKQPVNQEKQARQQLNAVIGQRVMLTLGQPGDLHRVQVRWLWEDHYRVNVLLGVDAASAKVAHSYFLVADGDGNILASTPKLLKRY
jgi:hypothetical protein